MSGSKHLEFLLDHKLLKPISLRELENIYSRHDKAVTEKASDNFASEATGSQKKDLGENILLEVSDGKLLAKLLEAHELAPEVERAVNQVKYRLKHGKQE